MIFIFEKLEFFFVFLYERAITQRDAKIAFIKSAILNFKLEIELPNYPKISNDCWLYRK